MRRVQGRVPISSKLQSSSALPIHDFVFLGAEQPYMVQSPPKYSNNEDPPAYKAHAIPRNGI